MTTPADILLRLERARSEAANAAATYLGHALADVEAMVREIQPTTAPDADAEAMRTILLAEGQEPSAEGLAELVRFARMGQDEQHKAEEALDELRRLLRGTHYPATADGLRALIARAERLIHLDDKMNQIIVAVIDTAGPSASPIDVCAAIRNGARVRPDLRLEVERLRAYVDQVSLERDAAAEDARVCRFEIESLNREIASGTVLADELQAHIVRLNSDKQQLRDRAETLAVKVAALTPGPWLDPATDPPPIGEVILATGRLSKAVLVRLSDFVQQDTWIYRWRRFPTALLVPPEVIP